MDWQTMDTAPKDGTAFLAFYESPEGYVADQRFKIVHWSGWGGGVWETDGGGKPSGEPIKWAQLKPPTPDTQPQSKPQPTLQE